MLVFEYWGLACSRLPMVGQLEDLQTRELSNTRIWCLGDCHGRLTVFRIKFRYHEEGTQ